MIEVVQDLAGLRLGTLGGTALTVGGVLTAVLIVAAAAVLARLVRNFVRRLRARSWLGAASFLYIVEKVATYGVVITGVIVAISTLGLDLTSLAVFAGALGVGVGLGLQGVVKEFVSGLVVVFDRLIQVGDYVELENGVSGVVQEIGPRATRIRNNDNVNEVVPNSRLVERTVTNWTLKGESRRIHVPFKVAFGADKDRVREAVLNAARAVPFTLPDTEARRTQVWLVGYGDGYLKFELVVWPGLEAVKRPQAMQAAYAWAIDDALCEAGIEVPNPQMDIRVRELFGCEGADALRLLGLKSEPTHPSAPAPSPAGHNDAANDLVAGAEIDRVETERRAAEDEADRERQAAARRADKPRA
ncbi:mechanosensitive ion channel domain-containing protein [Caulobacter sp. 17J80-11]|uniref:mechanosensitive ion channel family protein n=1 Tax=Caulobacter sp. 17J80-11 TaxID=2763502 RepID=UPI0016539C3C|nr:mechanosensitive ion channel [Caulobacter sp. 17J80-11]